MRKYFVMQHDQSDCGAACLAMILGYFGCKMPLSVIRMDMKTDINGSSMYGILTAAEKYGLSGVALSGSLDELLEEVSLNQIQLPIIVNVLSDEGYSHFIVIHKIRKHKLYVLDPASGGHWMKADVLSHMWIGNILSFSGYEDVPQKNKIKGYMRKYVVICEKQYRTILEVVVFSLIISLVGLIGSVMFEYVINGIYSERFLMGDYSVSENQSSPIDVILLNFIVRLIPSFPMLVFAIILLFLLQAVLCICRSNLLAHMTKKMNLPILITFYEHVLKIPYDFFSGRKTGDIVTRFSDASSVCQSISDVTLTILIDGTLAIVYGIFLFLLTPELFLIVVINLLIYGIVICSFKNKIKKNQMTIMSENSEVNTFLKESIVGIKTIKQLRFENSAVNRIFKKFSSLLNQYVTATMLQTIQSTIISFVSSTSTISLLAYGVWLCTHDRLYIGSLITFYVMMGSFNAPVKSLIGLQSQIQNILVSAERLEDAFAIQKKPIYITEHISSDQEKTINTLEISNLTYAYGFNNPTLKSLSFKIQKGETIAILGRNGCGKTTLAGILTAIVLPEQINVFVNGKEITFFEYRKYTQKIAYIPQESFFFSDTIYHNLTCGMEQIDEAKLNQLLTKCNLSDFINALPHGLHTVLDEDANNLSAGTKQKLAVVRALLRNPEIVILDEAMSNVDSESEKEIYALFSNLKKDIAMIDIFHKARDFSRYERVLNLQDGTLNTLS